MNLSICHHSCDQTVLIKGFVVDGQPVYVVVIRVWSQAPILHNLAEGGRAEYYRADLTVWLHSITLYKRIRGACSLYNMSVQYVLCSHPVGCCCFPTFFDVSPYTGPYQWLGRICIDYETPVSHYLHTWLRLSAPSYGLCMDLILYRSVSQTTVLWVWGCMRYVCRYKEPSHFSITCTNCYTPVSPHYPHHQPFLFSRCIHPSDATA